MGKNASLREELEQQQKFETIGCKLGSTGAVVQSEHGIQEYLKKVQAKCTLKY